MSIQSASLAHWTLFDGVLVAVLLFEDLGEAVVLPHQMNMSSAMRQYIPKVLLKW